MSRKLQGEIDKCFKKVQEGIETFEELYEKIYATHNQSQKEKLEQELKKEIKKLQRLRDQIKTWISSNEIKDKKQLMDTRKLIETQMEKFKACEREMKTKQYSKEGLMAKEKLDPAEVAKHEAGNWLSAMVDKLNMQIDALEAESEQINAAKGRRGAKVDTVRLKEIEAKVEKHKFHIAKLENMLRNLENEGITVDDVDSVKDLVEYYVDSNNDPDFLDDDEIYDHLNLIEDEHVGMLDDHLGSNESLDKSQGSKDEEKEEELAAAAAAAALKKRPSKDDTTKQAKASNKVKVTVTPVPQPKTSAPAPVAATGTLPPPLPPAKQAQPSIKYSSAASVGLEKASTTPATTPTMKPRTSIDAQTQQVKPPLAEDPKDTAPIAPASVSFSSIVAQSTVSSAYSQAPTFEDKKPAQVTSPILEPPLEPNMLPQSFKEHLSTYDAVQKRSFGFGDDVLRNQYLIQLLNSAFQQCPDISDAEKPITDTPPNPNSKAPSYYPKQSLVSLASPAIFERFDLDTLFFIFYYQQGTRQQYLAARELKRQSWRFHKKYMTWFQRHEEPRAITDEYEQGTYIYFDFEGTWCQRKKSEFTFEYRFLEGE